MRRHLIATAMAGVCALGLMGCSDESTAAPPTPTLTSSTTTATTPPTTSPPPTRTTPTLPVIPPQAGEKSIAGAKAFVGAFVREMNTAWTSTRTLTLRSLFAHGCESCASIADGIDRIHAEAGKTEGAIWSIRALTSIPLQPLDRPIIHAAISTSPGRWKPAEASSWRPIPSSTTQWDLHLTWTGKSWAMSQAVSQ